MVDTKIISETHPVSVAQKYNRSTEKLSKPEESKNNKTSEINQPKVNKSVMESSKGNDVSSVSKSNLTGNKDYSRDKPISISNIALSFMF